MKRNPLNNSPRSSANTGSAVSCTPFASLLYFVFLLASVRHLVRTTVAAPGPASIFWHALRRSSLQTAWCYPRYKKILVDFVGSKKGVQVTRRSYGDLRPGYSKNKGRDARGTGPALECQSNQPEKAGKGF